MPVENRVVTGNAIGGMRAKTVIMAMKCYLESGGKMQLTRIATPATMRAIATEFTGKTYPKSRKGLERAYADMVKLTNGKNLDQIGEIAKVNKEVGGVAADLDDTDGGT